jgi:hypothetical protein
VGRGFGEQGLHHTGTCQDEPRAAIFGSGDCNGLGRLDGRGGTRRKGDPAMAGAGHGMPCDALPPVARWPRLCHDLRTPLNAILGNTELLLDGSAGPLSSAARACLGDIQLAGQRLMHQVEALLELYRARSEPLASEAAVDLLALLRQARVAAPLDAPAVAIAGVAGTARYVVQGDPGWLKVLAHTIIELYLDGGGRGPLQIAAEPGGPLQCPALRLSWVDFQPQQVAALPLALIDAILALHDGDLLLSADGLRLHWPPRRVTGAAPGLPDPPPGD